MGVRLRRRRDLLGWLLLAGLVAAWWVTLRPASLGGPVTPVLVRGTSMEPGLAAGDLVLLRRAPPEPGAVLGAHVGREPGTGALVVHRAVARDALGWITHGDNLDDPDPWRIPDEQVVGRLWLRLPHAGTLALRLREPTVLGALAGGLTTVLLLLPAPAPATVTVPPAFVARWLVRRALPMALAALVLLAATLTVSPSPELGTWDCPGGSGPCTAT